MGPLNSHEHFHWISMNAIVDVPDYHKMPYDVMCRLDHIHEKGICKKNRYGAHCEVDNTVRP